MKINYKRLEPSAPERSKFSGRGPWSKPGPGCESDGPEPAYLVEVAIHYGDGDFERVPIALIERETMAGIGNYNMWGSRYRWAIRSMINMSSRKGRLPLRSDGVFIDYVDTLRDARETIDDLALRAIADHFCAHTAPSADTTTTAE